MTAPLLFHWFAPDHGDAGDAGDPGNDAPRARRPSVSRATTRNRETHPQGESTLSEEMARAARIRAGDQAAFEALFRELGEELLAYLTATLGTPEAAEDVLQEIMLRLWRRRAHFRPESSVRAYLFVATRNAALDRYRSAQRTQRMLTTYGARVQADTPASPDPGTTVDDERLRVVLAQAVQELPPRMREVWRLYREHGMSYPQIADVLGVTVGTVKTQMARAFTSLRAAAAPFLVAAIVFAGR